MFAMMTISQHFFPSSLIPKGFAERNLSSDKDLPEKPVRILHTAHAKSLYGRMLETSKQMSDSSAVTNIQTQMS